MDRWTQFAILGLWIHERIQVVVSGFRYYHMTCELTHFTSQLHADNTDIEDAKDLIYGQTLPIAE